MYLQSTTPNYNIPYVGGLCEGFVEGTVGQATLPNPQNPTTTGVYPTASKAWQAHPTHPNELPPRGVRVAVFFTLGSTPAGHVALSLEDGRVASSTQAGYHPTAYIHPSLDDLIKVYSKNNNGCTYLGWSEYIGKIKVVRKDDMYPTKDNLQYFYDTTGYLGHPPNANDVAYWCNGTNNPAWSAGASAVWKDLSYDVGKWVKEHPDKSKYEPVTVYRKVA